MVPTNAPVWVMEEVKGACQAKVHDHHPPLLTAHDVLRLEVAMNYALGMRSFEPKADLPGDFNRLGRFELALLAQERTQGRAVGKLHGDEFCAGVLAEIKDADHIAVRNLPGKDQLLLKTCQHVGAAGQLRTNRLQRDDSSQLQVVGLINGAHPALAEQFDHLVAPGQYRARRQARMRRFRCPYHLRHCCSQSRFLPACL